MATRNTVVTKITAINDDGNNTALEVRDVLTELLDYTENQNFRIFSETPINSRENNAKLFFSIKGVKDQTANMTIMIKSLATTGEATSTCLFLIPFNQTTGIFTIANFDILAGTNGNSIMPLLEEGNYLTYIIPVINNPEITQVTLTLAIIRNFRDFNNSIILSVQNFRTTAISTSISMHWQKFSESLFNLNNGNNTGGGTNLASGPRGKKENIAVEDLSFLEKIFGLNFK